jgi:hypothetical protein
MGGWVSGGMGFKGGSIGLLFITAVPNTKLCA